MSCQYSQRIRNICAKKIRTLTKNDKSRGYLCEDYLLEARVYLVVYLYISCSFGLRTMAVIDCIAVILWFA